MSLNMDEDAPRKRTTRSTTAGNKQKGKKGSGQQAKPASATHIPHVDGSEGVAEEDENEVMAMAQMEKVREEIKALEAQKEALVKGIAEASVAAAASLPMVERPPPKTNIQVGMRLSDDKPRYDAIRRLVRELVAAAGINWELPWAEIPARKKAKLYQAAREQAPYLKRFSNDWATEALAKQLLKNKQGHSYRRGYLDVPAKYAYLKENAAKKYRGRRSARATPALQLGSDGEEGIDQDDSRESTNMSMVATGSKSKRAAPVTVARKKQKLNTGTAKTHSNSRANEKQKASQKASSGSMESESEDVESSDNDEVDVEE
ncbi:hypothetical protein EDB86DRAFT_2836548 [Lactarius hatsudake]|nr:hypothetical protein EDB86DRAFT_2836548 [Lactarius hatsudake]